MSSLQFDLSPRPGHLTSNFLQTLQTDLEHRPDTVSDIFSPSSNCTCDQLSPTHPTCSLLLSLIARQSARLDPIETLHLLPPLVNAHGVKQLLLQSLRAPVFDSCVVREVSLARKEDVERQLVKLESSRVNVKGSWVYVGLSCAMWWFRA